LKPFSYKIEDVKELILVSTGLKLLCLPLIPALDEGTLARVLFLHRSEEKRTYFF
jgi:hypothetical protein